MCLETPELPELDSSELCQASPTPGTGAVFSCSALSRALLICSKQQPATPCAQPSPLTLASCAVYSIPGFGASCKVSD